jgi:hypothetical protein
MKVQKTAAKHRICDRIAHLLKINTIMNLPMFFSISIKVIKRYRPGVFFGLECATPRAGSFYAI